MKKTIILFYTIVGLLTAVSANSVYEKKYDSQYGVITKVGNKLYEVTFDCYEEYESEFRDRLSSVYKGSAPGCTSIWNDGMLLRNMDWYIKDGGVDVCELIVHTTANEGRYATVGVCFNPNITDETYASMSRGLDISLLDKTIIQLAETGTLPPEYKDHQLNGDWVGFRECHIKPDWLLIYAIQNGILTLTLARTGSHIFL